MTTKTEAIYENGVLRLAEKLALENGARVQVTIQVNGAPTNTPANGAPQGGSTPGPAGEGDEYRVPFDPAARAALEERAKNFDPEKTRAAMERIAALPIEGETDEFSGEDHDKILYGWDKNK